VQEASDLLAILNALRVILPGGATPDFGDAAAAQISGG